MVRVPGPATWRRKYGTLRDFFAYWRCRGKLNTVPMPPTAPKYPQTADSFRVQFLETGKDGNSNFPEIVIPVDNSAAGAAFRIERSRCWLTALPGEIEAGLDPKQISKMLGESLRQHFLRSGVQDTVGALQTTSAAMTGAQKDLSSALRALSDSHGGVVAQVERANNRIEYSLESRAKTMDALLHEWKSDLLRIWIPMAAGACMLIGLFGGMEIQGCRDAPAVTPSTTAAMPTVPPVTPQAPAKIPRHAKGEK